ncbi:hypothetical protein [Pseudoalteromonas sp. Ps84H-4]|uniref:hypothetical protein n=1 Tax=Pseudoalteromonas sp. Ps84H-4 TaxID=2954502 RepID=UPI002097BDF2|nr:hypothetical protein [Pseudoalteromonas sp. Ps84H-4]MCO7252216.1 hypothetical protein [Pseudoalteromonas sp. Ps84H-4]
MGLREKKAAREFEKNRFDSLKRQIFEAAKFEFDIEVNWETLAIDDYAHLYDQTWPMIYFEPTIKAFKEMCSDKFSKEAIEEDLKKLIIQNYGNVHNANHFATYSKGILTLNHSPILNAANQINERAESVQNAIEKEL